MSEEQTNLTCIAFFFFFYSYSLALREMFFMAEVVTMVDTTEFMLFCGSNFITSFFFLSPRASPSSASACSSSFSYLLALTFCSYTASFFSPCLGWMSFSSAWWCFYLKVAWYFWRKSRAVVHRMTHSQVITSLWAEFSWLSEARWLSCSLSIKLYNAKNSFQKIHKTKLCLHQET